jgi:hypothetical protein
MGLPSKNSSGSLEWTEEERMSLDGIAKTKFAAKKLS